MNPLDPSPAEKSAAIAEIESRLNANPSIARQLDGNGTGTRRQKIEATLNFIRARKLEIAATKASLSAKLAAARARLAALATVKATNDSLKAKLATARAPRPAPAPVTGFARPKAPAPSPVSAHEKYRQLQKTDPRAAAKFWNENQTTICSQINSH